MEIIYQDGTTKTGEDVYESSELKLARASYADNLDEVLYLLSKYPETDVNAIVEHSSRRGNGTPLILTGIKDIAEALIQKGADINLIYNNGRENITALDSALKELGKERVKEKETIKQEIEELIDFLKSKGAKQYNDLVAR